MSKDWQTVVAHELGRRGYDVRTYTNQVQIHGGARLIDCSLVHGWVELRCLGYPGYSSLGVHSLTKTATLEDRTADATVDQLVAYLTVTPDDFADPDFVGPKQGSCGGGPTPEFIRGWLQQLIDGHEPTLEELRDFYIALTMAQEYAARYLRGSDEYPPAGYYRRVFDQLMEQPHTTGWHGLVPEGRKWRILVDRDLKAWRSKRLIGVSHVEWIDMLILGIARQIAHDVGLLP